MNSIHLKNGFSSKIAGSPAQHIRLLESPRHVGMVPERIPFIKPRLLVEENDVVSIGSPLFEDKRNPRIRFVSPGGGQVTRIAFGPRRIIQKIIITLDNDEKAASVDVPKTDQIPQMRRSRLVEILLAGGMWPFLRVLPFMDIADPDIIPPAIIVRLGDNEPFGPVPSIYIQGREKAFAIGIDLLKALCDCVVINITGDQAILESLPQHADIQHFSGNYPSGHPGYQLYRTKKGPEQNRTWYIDGQEVALLGEFIHSGSYPTRRIMSVGGSLAPDAGHVDARAGAPLKQLCAGPISGNSAARYVVGGVYSGFTGDADGFMGFYQNALNLLDEGDREEFFGFIRPGYRKPSNSTAFLSAVRRRPFPMDCGQHGEVRACVNCGYCAKVCPVDILPQFTMKCLVADEVEEALAHGLLDCIECSLCTYVCPSKIELREVLRKAKAQYYKETA